MKTRWIEIYACCLMTVMLGVGCGEPVEPQPDGDPDESFLVAGAADSLFGIEEGSTRARGILRLVNEASLETLEELDSISWIDKRAFSKLYAYAEGHGYFEEEVERRELPDCTLETAFQEQYGQPFRWEDVAWRVSANGRSLTVYGKVEVKASSSTTGEYYAPTVKVGYQWHRLTSIAILDRDTAEARATRNGNYLRGLSHAAQFDGQWSYSLEATIKRQFVLPAPTDGQLRAHLELLVDKAVASVPASDREKARRAGIQFLAAARRGEVELEIGKRLAGSWDARIDGHRYHFDLSYTLGIKPRLGLTKAGVYNTVWVGLELEPACDQRTVASYDGTTYVNVDESQTWTEARQTCQSYGGDLVKIESSLENAFVRSMTAHGNRFIGLSDRSEEGTFVWTDGSEPTYTQFASGEPNDWSTGEDCGHMRDESRGGWSRWNDVPCDNARGFICEIGS